MVAALLGGITPSHARADDGFQVIELSQAPAADVAALVERALALQGDKAELIVDAPRNRLLVRGPAALQRRVRELVKTLEQGSAAVKRTAPPLSRQPTAAISAPRGGDVPRAVVRANVITRPTANVQASYSEELSQGAAAPRAPIFSPRKSTPAAKSNKKPAAAKTPWPYQEVHELAARPSDGGQTVLETRAVKLKHLSADALPERMKAVLGGRLLPLVTTTEKVNSFVMQLAGRRPLEIHIEKEASQVVLRGPEQSTRYLARLIEALDEEPAVANGRTHVVSLRGPSSPYVQRALAAVAMSGGGSGKKAAAAPLLARLFQPKRGDDAAETGETENQPAEPAEQDRAQAMPAEGNHAEEDDHGALSGDVEIEEIPELGAIIVRGSQRDVERVMKIIEEVEKLSAETEPVIELYPLRHIASEAMWDVVEPLYNDELAPRQGRVSITPLIHPNSLLLIGRAEGVKAVSDLIRRLDQPGGPASQFEVFRLKHATAASAATTLNTTFGTFNPGLGVRVRVTADARTNALIVQAGPRDLLEVTKLLKQLDQSGSASVNELRLFRLRFASAQDVAQILNAAVQRTPQQGQPGGAQQQPGAGQQGQGQFQQQPQQQQQPPPQQRGQQAQQGQPGQGPGQGQPAQETKAVMLRLLTVDEAGNKQLRMGHLGDARITADVKSNTVVVSAPAESLDLIAMLISQLDVANAVPAQIKVFTVENGDATNMVTMLEDLFQISGASMAVNGPQAMGPEVAAEEGGRVPLRFSVDVRTNSIVASGSASDLLVVEAILIKLDSSDVRERRSVVYKLKNAPALDVALALNEYLQKERQTQQTAPGLMSPFEKIEREVVVVPELVTNSLIVSATPRFFDEIAKIVEQLDARAPMVMIQVMIAEVTLNNTDEFGVELGLQNSVMFDRSLLSNLQLITTTVNQGQPGGGVATTTNQNIVAANTTPGFDFNNPTLQGAVAGTAAAGTTTSPSTFGIGLPNSASVTSLNTASSTGQQLLSNFGMGRVDSNLGYGGLALSLSSNMVDFLLRALRERDRLDVLSRPQIMTLDNQPAYIVVGQRVPLLQGSTVGLTGTTTGVNYTPVGLIVAVTPRITPDGLVVMEIDAEKSLLAPLSQGIAVGFGALGQVLRQPLINVTQAQTTISAMDGQTVVFGGMITQSNQVIQRRVPGLSEIPILGRLFRYDYQNGQKTELLVIMTPHIIRNEADAERLKRIEAGRISWCLSDVQKLHGEAGLRGRHDDWLDKEVPTVYPDVDPIGAGMPEAVPAPPGQPGGPLPGPRGMGGGGSVGDRPQPVGDRPQSGVPGPQPTAPGPRLQMPRARLPLRDRPSISAAPRRAGPPAAGRVGQASLRAQAHQPAPGQSPPPVVMRPTVPGATSPRDSHRRQASPANVQQLQFVAPEEGSQ